LFCFCVFFFKLTDPEYKQFLESYSVEEEKTSASPEILLGEIEAKTRELIGLFYSFLLFSLLRYFMEYISNSPFS
jgi:hypothetical protein